MNQQIAELAEQIGVTYGDVLALASGIAAGMEADKVADVYLDNEAERVTMCGAYMASQVRKVEAVQIDYMTKPECAQQLRKAVFAGLTQ